jgi:glycosyltransferase involved in cell wall biosynthesis
MRILVITNFYPPHYIGGYELGCKDVVDRLRLRGHEVSVLTSTYGIENPEHSGHVYRWLQAEMSAGNKSTASDFFELFKKESINRRAFERVCELLDPELVYVWNATHISISIALKAQECGRKVSYFISDQWLTRWEHDSLYSLRHHTPGSLHRRILWRPVAALLTSAGFLPSGLLDLARVQFASRFLKLAALEFDPSLVSAEVIHWGIDTKRFTFNEEQRSPERLLYVGQLTALKGVSTAVQALRVIVDSKKHNSATLTIVGGPDYGDRIHQLVSDFGLENRVRFTGLLQRALLPQIYREHDILLFPSVWDEPFSIVLLEAMSSGLAVVGTNSGGSAEILEDGVNALVFSKSDPESCASQVLRLVQNPDYFQAIRRNGRRTIEGCFELEKMVDKIEASLKKQIGAAEIASAATGGAL